MNEKESHTYLVSLYILKKQEKIKNDLQKALKSVKAQVEFSVLGHLVWAGAVVTPTLCTQTGREDP